MVVALRRKHDVFSAHARRPDVSTDDAPSSSMSTLEKLVSASEDVVRNVQSVWYDIATAKARLEPVDTLSKAFASTLRGLLVKGHLCVAGMSTQSSGPFWRGAADRRDCLVTCIMICISENREAWSRMAACLPLHQLSHKRGSTQASTRGTCVCKRCVVSQRNMSSNF